MQDVAERLIFRGDEGMKVVRHDHPRIQRWLRTKTTHEGVADIGASKKAFAMASIEPLMPLLCESGVKLVLLILGQRVNVSGLLQAVSVERRIAALLPLVELFLRHGIRKPGGDEVGDVGLPPVREAALMDVKLVVRPEESGFGFSRRFLFWIFT